MRSFRINPERVFTIFSSIFLFVAFYSSLHLELRVATFIPSQTVVSVIHAVSFVISLVILFYPAIYLQVIVLLAESVLTTMTGYMPLGIFLFYAIIILMFAKGQLKQKPFASVCPIVIIHIAAIISTYKQSWHFVALGLSSTLFYGAFFYLIYDILKAKLSCYLPSNSMNNTVIKEKIGEALHLSDYNLSERQTNFVLDNLHENCSYKDLSEKYFVSLSTVKKEFSEIFRIFDVKKLEELHILLLQYQVSR